MNQATVKYQKKGIRPLFVNTDYIIAAKRNSIYRCSLDLQDCQLILKLPIDSYIQYLGVYSRTFDRILRTTPTKMQHVDKEIFLLFRNSQIWNIDINSAQAKLEFTIPLGRKALDCTFVNLPGFEAMHVFGDYFHNPKREPVSLWGRSIREQQWRRVYTFQAQEIEHIHALIPDPQRNLVWIFTGDFDHSAGIWVAKSNFTDVQPVLRNNQIFRAAWLADIEGRLIYATDTQLDSNGIYELKEIEGTWTSIKLDEMDASSIYSSQGEDMHYFSTTIEPGEPTGILIKDLFDRKLGAGIKTNYAKIYSIDKNGQTNELLSAKKDWMPLRLGQFGSFSFPTGIMPNGSVIAYGIAVKGFDDVCFILSH